MPHFILPEKWGKCLIFRNVRGLSGGNKAFKFFLFRDKNPEPNINHIECHAFMMSLLLYHLLVPSLNQALQLPLIAPHTHQAVLFFSCLCVLFLLWDKLSSLVCTRHLSRLPDRITFFEQPSQISSGQVYYPFFCNLLFTIHPFIIKSTAYIVYFSTLLIFFQIYFSVFPTKQKLFGVQYCD